MEDIINTELGLIFCRFNEEKDDFDKVRLIDIYTSEETGKKAYTFAKLDDNCHCEMSDDPAIGLLSTVIDEEEYNKVRREYTILKSEGIMSITNIVAAKSETRTIRDVLAIYFNNNRKSGVPNAHGPCIVARQGINNLFCLGAGGEVGISVSIDTLPNGYCLADFMENLGVISSRLCHVYKTDTAKEFGIILENDTTTEILKELYDGRVNYKKNTDFVFSVEMKEGKINIDDKNTSIDGYCQTIERFLDLSDFMGDLYNKIGIIRVDFNMAKSTPLTDDQRLMCSILLNGARIYHAEPIKFDYEINMKAIKMKYFLAIDPASTLWLVPYTSGPQEVDPKDLYDLTDDATTQILERLRKVVRAYTNKSDE